MTDWKLYRKCSQVCRAEPGQPCVSQSGRIINGRPDGVRIELYVPHKARKMKAKAARARNALAS